MHSHQVGVLRVSLESYRCLHAHKQLTTRDLLNDHLFDTELNISEISYIYLKYIYIPHPHTELNDILDHLGEQVTATATERGFKKVVAHY